MTDWTLRLVACAGLVALLGRVPPEAPLEAAFGVVLAAAALLAVVALAVVLASRRTVVPEIPA